MGGLVWFDKIFQGPTSFIAYERGWVIFEYSHVFRSGGSLVKFKSAFQAEVSTRIEYTIPHRLA
jgi:hypothetical protein